MKETLGQIVNNAASAWTARERKFAKLSFGSELNPKHVRRAVKKFGIGAAEMDVHLLYNSAAYFKGASGILLTSEAIYRSKDMLDRRGRILLTDLYSADVSGRNLYINETPFALKMASEVSARLFAEVLSAVQSIVVKDVEGTRLRYHLEVLENMRASKAVKKKVYEAQRAFIVSRLPHC